MIARSLALVLATASVAHAAPCREPAATATITAAFKASSSLRELVTWAAGFTCKTVVYSAEVEAAASTVTIVAPRDMTPKQALALFVDSLEALGLEVAVKSDSIAIKLGKAMPAKCDAVAATPPVAVLPDDAPTDITKLLDAHIVKTDATHYTIDRVLVDKLLENPMALAKGARIVPAKGGFKVFAIYPTSVFARLGFANGDLVTKINGMEMTSADKALEVYTSLREAKAIAITVIRRGKRVTLKLTIN